MKHMGRSQENYIMPSNKIITSNRRKIVDHSFFTCNKITFVAFITQSYLFNRGLKDSG